jgi:Mg-chelatase subunit ChlD
MIGTRASCTVALVAVAGVTAGGWQTPVFRARTDIVSIDVSVKDGARAITSLTKDDFELRDRGVVQKVFDFQRERQPLDLTITLDASGSMTGAKLEALRRAMTRINAALEPEDRVEVVSFDTHVRQLAPLASPPMTTTVTSTGGGTSVLDALLLSLVKPPVNGRRQLDILMTDAGEGSSEFESRLVRRTAEYSSTQMSFVFTRGRSAPGGRTGPTLDTMRDVARTTGGQVVEIDADENLSETFLAAIEDFRTSYVLRYTPAGVKPEGWHEVTVSVKQRNYTVRARRGYRGIEPG